MSCVLLVHGVGGPPLEYALPKVAAHATVHVLAVTPLPVACRGLWGPLCASVTNTAGADGGEGLVSLIKRQAVAVRADAILTLSEFAVIAVAKACEELNLAGGGPHVVAARDKRAMRATWQRAGVPVPGFAPVFSELGIREAFERLRPPLLLKSAWGAGSTGLSMVHDPDEAVAAWWEANALMRATTRVGYGELHVIDADADFLLEEIVTGSTEGWFTEPGWGDYVSVEGMVAGGVHHALCISGRLPTVPPFTERGSVAPVAMAEHLQRRIESVVQAAVDALRLDTCATHTEVKLGADGQMWVIETAARFGGVLITRQVEEVYGLDMIGMLVRQLLGEPVDYPERMLTEGRGAAASLVVLPVDGAGEPWERETLWDFRAVDWLSLLSPDSTIEVVPELSRENGTPMTPYASGEGGRSRAAVCFVRGADARTVVDDCGRIVDALPTVLPTAPPDTQAPAGQPRTQGPAAYADRALLDLERFAERSGTLAGHPYVKVVVDRERGDWHLLDHAEHGFHTHYIADRILGMDWEALHADIDTFNYSVYQDPDRRFLLGVLSLHHRESDDLGAEPEPYLTLETVEADTMGAELLVEFNSAVRTRLDPSLPLLFKPANHLQEAAIAAIPDAKLPRIAAYKLHVTADFTVLNTGEAYGRLRRFTDMVAYRAAEAGGDIARYDILALPVVPDDMPQVAGLISTRPTIPLSHTNVLAAGWGIPNAIVRDLDTRLTSGHSDLDGAWVRYAVTDDNIVLEPADEPADLTRTERHREPVVLGEPRIEPLPVRPLSQLRTADRHAYGTKAANLGELHHVLRHGSPDLAGFYAAPRPPRANLLHRLAGQLDAPYDSTAEQLAEHAAAFLRDSISVPEGIAVPFSAHQDFLTGSPHIQQRIGMLKLALRLGSDDELDALCAELQDLVRNTALPENVMNDLTAQLLRHVPGTAPLVVRSSSNAEGLPGFSAAGLYDSVTHVTDLRGLAAAVRRVWASVFSARSVRLRHRADIPLDETYMGVVVQRRQKAAYGGVMVTCNPTRRDDFRNVCVNCAAGSVESVVDGTVLPRQYLFNTVEGGARTLSLGDAAEDLDPAGRERLARLALVGRLLQGHFCRFPEYATPLDVEWLLDPEGRLHIVQVRAYAG